MTMATCREGFRATRLLAGLRLRRLRNMYASAFRWQRRSGGAQTGAKTGVKSSGPQPGTRARAAVAWLMILWLLSVTLFSLGDGVRDFLLALYCHSQPTCKGVAASHVHELAARVRATGFNGDMLRGLAMLTGVLWLISVLYPFTLSLRAGPEWDFEWLSTLPMSRTALLGARIAERGIVNPIAWVALVTPALVVAWHAGAGWLAPVWAIAVAVPLLFTVSSVWTALDMGLHIVLAPNAMRNLQAVLGIALTPAIFFVVYLNTPNGEHYSLLLADHTPDWSIWTPPGLAIQALAAPTAARASSLYGLLLFETALIVLLAVAFLRYQLRAGLVSHGARESGRSTRADHQRGARKHARVLIRLSPVVRRELALLMRDRRLLAQLFGVPLLVIGGQFFLNGHLAGKMIAAPAMLASFAFGVGAYVLLQSALQTLATEQGTLWLLYTFPRPIMRVLWEKARFYFALALVYPAMICVAGLALSHAVPWHFAANFVFALLGLAVYTVIAISLGVLAGVHSRWSKALYAYLFMLLMGLYAYTLYMGQWRLELPMLALCGAMAFALWQKAGDRLPWLLDPEAAPPPAVSLADGLIAATIFFVVQIIAILMLAHDMHGDTIARLVLAYVCAGAVTYALARGSFKVLAIRGVPKVLGPHAARGLWTGAGAGVLCACVGLAYLWAARRYGFEPHVASTASAASARPISSHLLPVEVRVLIGLLTVCAAPVFEEFVFRGLIFGGLRRSLNLPLSAVASAALFAIVHPSFSLLPVFVLGLGTAWVYERKRMLLAPMATHAVYNAIILGFQLAVLHP